MAEAWYPRSARSDAERSVDVAWRSIRAPDPGEHAGGGVVVA
jgi:hypothetical protein